MKAISLWEPFASLIWCKSKPIETAPKDGTPILEYADGDMAVVSRINLSDRYWSLCVSGAFAEDSEWAPTHWMELPGRPDEE